MVDNNDVAIGVRALAWLAADADRVDRFCALTGVAPDSVPQRAREPAFLAAALDFIGYGDEDFTACAAALDLSPEALAATARRLGGGGGE